jgi:hypothetical protein
MHLFIELLVLAAFVATMTHLVRGRRDGAWLLCSFAVAGWVRESFVIVMRYLYGFAPLALVLGATPVISFVIWGFSIYAALLWAETVVDPARLGAGERHPGGRLLAGVALFMVALAVFYEPFLKLIAMARWEAGTRATLDVPWIALVGYPSMAVLLLLVHATVMRRTRGVAAWVAALVAAMSTLAVAHAAALQQLKRALGW